LKKEKKQKSSSRFSVKNSITTKMMLFVVSIMIASLGFSTTVSFILNSSGSLNILNVVLSETVETAAVALEKDLQATSNLIGEIGMIKDLSDENLSQPEKQAILDERKKLYGFKSLFMTDANGVVTTNGYSLAGEEFYQTAMRGEIYIDTPRITIDGSDVDMVVGAPIWKDGVYGSEVVGTIFGVFYGDYVSNMISDIKVGQTGRTFVINNVGTRIGDKDQSIVARQNDFELAGDSKVGKLLMEAEKKAINGELAYALVQDEGVYNVVVLAPVGGTDGWAIGLEVATREFIESNRTATKAGVAVAALCVLIGSLAVIFIVRRLLKPISDIEGAVAEITKGNFDVDINSTSTDEIGRMADSLNVMKDANHKIVADTVRCLEEMANGNFATHPNVEYVGLYKKLEEAIRHINVSMSNTLQQIEASAEEVRQEAEQVANGAQMLAQGSTEQAATIEELSASIQNISSQIKDSASYAEEVSGVAQNVGQDLMDSNTQMQQMMDAMNEISNKSEEIRKIIKTIEDIAFQTNILALNAAVEAARAGAAGKGFAVVADEVRNLASKSAEAAKDTTVLIEDTVDAVNNGLLISDQTSEKLNHVLTDAQKVVNAITDIAGVSVNQAQGISEITTGLDQISSVVQSNSATAEESAATSEQLSSQAAILQTEISHFKIQRG